MSVYVDHPKHPYGRMIMCHMMADTTDELLAMADAIGVQRKWLQNAGTATEHFDVCKAKRDLAIQRGAVTIVDSRELVRLIRMKRTAPRRNR